jgi:plastocyanin
MRPGSPRFDRRAFICVTLAVLALGATAAGRVPRLVPEFCTPGGGMNDAKMAAMSAAHYAARPAHGFTTNGTPVDTFFTAGLRFNADHNLATTVDTVHILAGQTVLFKWVSSVHTVTSGDYTSDGSDWGKQFDFPLDSAHPEVSVTYPDPGTYPFLCQYHYWAPMAGCVVVEALPTPTAHPTWGGLKAKYR